MSCSKDDDNTKPNTEEPNTPPTAFSLIEVADKAVNVEVLPDFSWEAATDADGDTVTYDLYLGTEESPKLYAGNIKDTHFKIIDQLNLVTQYYWKVIAKDGKKGVVESNTFSFTTKPNTPPASFSLISVADKAINVDVVPDFSWQAATDVDGDTVMYDLYLGSVENLMILYAENITELSFKLTQPLSTRTQYYWKVIAKDSNNGVIESETFSFTTREPNPLTIRDGHTSEIFNNKIWVIGGFSWGSNDIYHSVDGLDWIGVTNSTFPARSHHTSVVFDNKIWIIGGRNGSDYKNDVWNSSDGITWTKVTEHAAFSARSHHASVVFNDKIWVIGGGKYLDFKNDVWNSSDGIIWKKATGNAPFSERVSHASVVFNNKIWVLGGEEKKDVWSSADGITWTQAIDNAAFSSSWNFPAVVFNNKMWVIGGYGGNDVWNSTDGATWVNVTNNAAFPERGDHSSVIFDNKMWVIAGHNAGNKNDVWSSIDGVTWIESK